MKMKLSRRLDRSVARKLSRVKEISEMLWQKDAFGHIHYTIHGVPHSKRTVSLMKKLLDQWMDTPHLLNKSEIFLLLSSAYLHDIGMLLGKKGEDPEDVRKDHEIRGFDFIQEEKNRLLLGLNEAEAGLISLLVKAHRNVPHKDSDFDDAQLLGDQIRLRFLSAVLRLADELDIAYVRAPTPLRDLLTTQLPDYSYLQWMRHLYTTGVRIDQRKIAHSVELGGLKTLQIELSPIQIEIHTHFPQLEYVDLIGRKLILDSVQKAVIDVYPVFVENFLPINPRVDLRTRITKGLVALPANVLEKWRRKVQLSEALLDVIRYYYTRIYSFLGATGKKHPISGHDILRVRGEIKYSTLNASLTSKWLAGNGVFLTLGYDLDIITDEMVGDDIPKYVEREMGLEFHIGLRNGPKDKRKQMKFVPLEFEINKLSAEEIIEGTQLDQYERDFENNVFVFTRISKSPPESKIFSLRAFYAKPILPKAMVDVNYSLILPMESDASFVNHIPYRTKGLVVRFEDFPDNYEFYTIRNLLVEEEGSERPRIIDFGIKGIRYLETDRLLSPGSLVATIWRGK